MIIEAMHSRMPARSRRWARSIGLVIGFVCLVGHALPGLAQGGTSSPAQPAANPSIAACAPSAEARFSDLSEITSDNVVGLRLAFSFRTDSPRGHAGEPRAVGSTLLVLT